MCVLNGFFIKIMMFTFTKCKLSLKAKEKIHGMIRAYIRYEDLQKTTNTCFFQIFPRLLRQGSSGRRTQGRSVINDSPAVAALPKKARENLKKTSNCSFLKIFVSYVCSSF